MLRAIVPAFAALAVASATLADMTSMQGVGISASGAFTAPGLAPDAWTIRFEFDGDAAASSTIGEFGNWTFSLSNGSQTWLASGESSIAGRWSSYQGSRIYTIDLAQAGDASSSGSLVPSPSSISIVYTAVKTGGAWCSLADALQRSQGSSYDPLRGGFVIRTGTTGSPDAGTITSGFTVPAPGALALVGCAAVLARRRKA